VSSCRDRCPQSSESGIWHLAFGILVFLLAQPAREAWGREPERIRVAVVARPVGDWHAAGVARAALARLGEIDRILPANVDLAQRLVPSEPGAAAAKMAEAGKLLRAQFVVLVTAAEKGSAEAEVVEVGTGASQRTSVHAPDHELPGRLALGLAELMRLPLSPADRERVGKPLVANEAAAEALWKGDRGRSPAEQARLYELALHHDPGSPLIHNQLGAALARAGQLDRACEEFDRAIATLPTYAAPHTNKGLVLRRQQKWAEAEEEFRKAITLGTKSPAPYVELAQLLDRLGGPKAAVEQLEKAVEIDPSHIHALMTLAVYYFEQANFPGARRDFERILELEPENIEALNHLGLLFLVPQDYEKAEATFRKALSIKADSPETLANLALALYGQKKVKEALASLDRAIALDRRFAPAYYYRGQIQLTEKRFDEAAESFQRAVELNPDMAAARQGLAAAQLARRSTGKGCGCLPGWLPWNSGPQAALGTLLPVALLLAPHVLRLARRRNRHGGVKA